jgi:hypothetical protein
MSTRSEPKGPSITRILRAEHAWLDALLEEAIHACLAGRAGEAREQTCRLVFALRSHLAAESAILIGPVERRKPGLTGPLRAEIDRVGACIDALDRDLDAGADALASALARLRNEVLPHERREEAGFLPACDDALDADQRAAAVREFGRRLW